MGPAPLPRAHSALVILASFLVAGALLPWSPRLRLACAAGAIGIMLFLAVARLRAHAAPAPSNPTQARVDQIRAERAARMGRRR